MNDKWKIAMKILDTSNKVATGQWLCHPGLVRLYPSGCDN